MPRLILCLLSACLVPGCESRQFVQVAPGVAVSSESIDDYARQQGVSREVAKQRLAAEATSQPAAE
ncbi:MAG: hypothetical protein JNG89_08795 [Planctomycetaceae bacterium]|nr:hypothetical protein [Planctomycetaceae bacterium]